MSIAVETSEPFSEIERGGPQARKSTKPQDHGGGDSSRCSVVRRRVTQGAHPARAGREPGRLRKGRHAGSPRARRTALPRGFAAPGAESTRRAVRRSEEHTSELQSLRHIVFRLLLEKKKSR